MITRLLALTAVFLLCACQTVTTYENGTTEVRSFGAGTTYVSADGDVEVKSPGLSEGLTGVVTYALTAVAAFFHVAPPTPPPPVEITIKAAE